MHQIIEAWMFRVEGENLALFASLILTLALGIIFSTFNLYISLAFIFLGFIYVKLHQAQYMGNSVRVHAHQYPEIYEIFKSHAIKLGIQKANLYIKQDPSLNAFTIGINVCSVILTSALVEQFNKEELSFVIGHELGHFKAGHTKITTLINPLGTDNFLVNMIFGIWQRKAEYSSDRCGLILTKNIENALQSLVKLSIGGVLYKNFNMDGYIEQLKSADTNTVKWSEVLLDHPLITNRVRALYIFWKKNFRTNK